VTLEQINHGSFGKLLSEESDRRAELQLRRLSQGRIRTTKRIRAIDPVESARRVVNKLSTEPDSGGCIKWTCCVNACGYGTLSLGRETLANRVLWRIFIGDIPDGMCVLHKCDTPRCGNLEHLFLGTHTDNVRDCFAKSRHPSKRLTDDQVSEIREIHRTQRSKTGNTCKIGLHHKLANSYGVTADYVRHITCGMERVS